jgi:hypothetical protein
MPPVIDAATFHVEAPAPPSRVVAVLEGAGGAGGAGGAVTAAAGGFVSSKVSSATSTALTLLSEGGGVRFDSLGGDRLFSGDVRSPLAAAVATGSAQAAARLEGALADAAAGTIGQSQRFFEFAHLSSPLALLSDGMASFIEDSASLPVGAAQARRGGPWMLTASVVAADVVLLTYMYRQSRRMRRRYHFARAAAHAYGYEPFAS